MRKTSRLAYLFLVLFVPSLSGTVNVAEFLDSTDIEITIAQTDWNHALSDSFPSVAGWSFITEAGAPELPKAVHPFLFSKAKVFGIKVLAVEQTSIQATISPSKGFVSMEELNTERTKGPQYERNQFYPSTLFNLRDEFCIRNQVGRVLEIYPYRYNPVKKELIITNYLKLRVYHTDKAETKSKKLSENTTFVNAPEWLDENNYGPMLIIAPDSFKTTLNPFIVWKHQKGIQTFFVSSDSASGSSQIKEVVNRFYEDKHILYLLLVGDHQQVASSVTRYGYGDNNYGYLQGNDFYLDLYVGRFPAETSAQLRKMINKSIAYEKGAGQDESFTHFLGIASDVTNIGDAGETDLEHLEHIVEELEKAQFTTSLITPGTEASTSISQAINAGTGLVCYSGHGDAKHMKVQNYNMDSVKNLLNKEWHPFFIDVACENGAFTSGTCLAEAMLRAENAGEGTGFLAVLASTISQPWNPPMCGQDEMINSITGSSSLGKSYTLGSICASGFSQMIHQYGSGGAETAATWNLFGDPSLYLWSSKPVRKTISSDEKLNVRSETFVVKGDNNTLLTLSMNDIIVDTAIIQDGEAVLTYSTLPASDSIVLTACNYGVFPIQKRLSLYSDGGPYYGLERMHLKNSNNLIENSDTFLLLPEIRNYGNRCGEMIRLEIIDHDSCFIPLNDIIFHDSLPANSSAIIKDFLVVVTENNADQTEGRIKFKITDSEGQQNFFEQTYIIHSADLQPKCLIVNGDIQNSNSFVFQGDSLFVQLVVSNTGHAPSKSISGELILNSFYMACNDNVQSMVLNPQQSDTFSFLLEINPNIYPCEVIKSGIRIKGEQQLEYALTFVSKYTNEKHVGNMQYTVSEYPFFNYYKSNKSQFLFHWEELGNQQVIDSIGFHISDYPNSQNQTVLSNFSMRFLSTSLDHFDNRFADMSAGVLVCNDSLINIPKRAGWMNFDVADYEVLTGSNLIVEVAWGPNLYCTPYQNSFEVFAHKTEECSTVFGYQDTGFPPAFRNTANLRPDVRFVSAENPKQRIHIQLNEIPGMPKLGYTLKIGSQTVCSDKSGLAALSLSEGIYDVDFFENENLLLSELLTVSGIVDTVVFTMYPDVTGVRDKTQAKGMSFFYDQHYIRINSNIDNFKVKMELYTVSGVKLWTKSVSKNHPVYIGSLSPGVYILNSHVQCIKLIKN